VSHDPESTLRPLRGVAVDVEALRAGEPRAGAVVRVARAAETVLRRMLRDDPTARVDLRLRALSADDLPADELLAELRRRGRLPMELAAAFHDLASSAERLVQEGGEATARDAAAATSLAEGLSRHVRAHPFDASLEDPVLTPDETLMPASPREDGAVHAVPPQSAARPVWPWALAALALVLVLLAFVITRDRGTGTLDAAAAAYRGGDRARAEQLFRQAAREDSAAPLPRYYLAQIYRESGRTAEAARELRAGLRSAPDDPGLNTELGYLLLDSHRPAEAVERLGRALQLDSASVRAWGGLVRALREAGRPAQAEQVLARAPAEVRALMGDPASPP